jgi:cell division protein FtsA
MPIDPIVALEIGTSKTMALVGELRDGGQLFVTGIGVTQSIGVRKGEVVDIEKAALCAKAAIAGAEESGQIDIRSVHLVVTGGHIGSLTNRGTLSLLHGGSEITKDDMRQVTELARSVSLPPDRDILHSVNQRYSIDGDHVVQDPEGLAGVKLDLDMLLLHGVRTRIKNSLKVIDLLKLETQDVAFGGLCSALAVLIREQKDGGAIVLDLGGGTTDYAVYSDGALADAGVLAVGGDHVTNDITMAFNLSSAQAEHLKIEAGCLPPQSGAPQRVSVPQDIGIGTRTVDAESLAAVIDARISETLSVVRRQVEKTGRMRVGGGVVLTGGGSRMKGLGTIVDRVFGLPCSVAKPRGVAGLASAEAPECSACVGMLRYGFQAVTEKEPSTPIRLIRRWLGR